jgi:hypothetical protein
LGGQRYPISTFGYAETKISAARVKKETPVNAISASARPEAHLASPRLPPGDITMVREVAVRFDLVSLRMAVLCAQLGSLSAAARGVHCSLSTASYRLHALEDCVGAQLFTRTRRGLHTTHVGDLFVGHAQVILERVELMCGLVRGNKR